MIRHLAYLAESLGGALKSMQAAPDPAPDAAAAPDPAPAPDSQTEPRDPEPRDPEPRDPEPRDPEPRDPEPRDEYAFDSTQLMEWAVAAWTCAAAAWKHTACLLHVWYVMARSYARQLLGVPAPAAGSPRVYRVYLFNEGPDTDAAGYHRELSPRYLDPDTWERDVRELTGWAAFRVEIRYEFRHKKYRMVLRPGDAMALPPYADASAPSCRLPKGVLSARLQGPLGSGIDCDVTSRVMKYQGPRGDFHSGLGLEVRMHDMFPFDDVSDNCARFTHLRIMDVTGRLLDLPFGSNPALSLAHSPAAPPRGASNGSTATASAPPPRECTK